MGKLITIDDWYQLDFKLDKPPKAIMKSIAQLIDKLKAKKLADKWFYLFEGKTLRLRFHSNDPDRLNKTINKIAQKLGLTPDPEHPFEPYSEGNDMFASPEMVETFANIMAELSKLTIKRVNDKKVFGNYRLVERLSHCIFNNVYGSDTEKYFLLKKMGVDFQSQDNPEQTVTDDNQQYTLTQPIKISIPQIKIPKKS
ncbi:MAG TPA: lantibiotic dehydratase C-terminal domain-containing protein [Candidatus Bathyarchaeia archaeon]|nr:lantibiotic dehydratase C-terminal domain-containing protein [Candidatus Bathyarchaeia archaeon]